MTGGRLSLDDRQSIATWLSEGEGFAEIGRRLGRPTSTISREVARNGDGGYAADRAQDASKRRGHRRRSSAPPSSGGDRESDFVDEFAALVAATGMPRMASRVFTSLLTSPSGAVTAADLVRLLRVSPASVSKAIGYLEAMDLVRREANPGGRRERYVIDDDVWLRALRTDSGAHAKVADAAHRGIAIFGADSPAGVRLGQMAQFFTDLSTQIRGTGLADPAVRDAMTVLAALAYVARPLSADDLVTALQWSETRLAGALEAIGHLPSHADPFTLEKNARGYLLQPRRDRLSPAQRRSLGQLSRAEPRGKPTGKGKA